MSRRVRFFDILVLPIQAAAVTADREAAGVGAKLFDSLNPLDDWLGHG